jgi:hypothetical protein
MGSTQEITWRDCVQACDDLLDTLQHKMHEQPEHGTFWQERMAVTMAKRQEFIILAREQRRQEEEQFKQAMQKIYDNVLERSHDGEHQTRQDPAFT